jgi:hypothetical protein
MELMTKIPARHSLSSIRNVIITGLLIVVSITAFTQVIIVKQDGTGDFSIIQEAVDVSVDGDTIVIYPGVYYENVDITGKGIVLASTWILLREDSLIGQTIIDGDNSGSCIRSLYGENWSQVIGLSLKHGFGTNTITIKPKFYGNGGGILIKYSKIKVIKCIISENFALDGGGICSISSSIDLIGNTIFHNQAVRSGGGIRIAASSIPHLDSLVLNNVYLNFGASGSDIAISNIQTPFNIWLDTATVQNPDKYYIGILNDRAVLIGMPNLSVLHGKIEQSNSNLYVSITGDDSNSGLTPAEPLKTISFALLKIASDSISMKTIFIANGIYSKTLTGERTPLQLKNYVILNGHSMENTIIDCEDKYEGARFAFGQDVTKIKNITFQNGNGYPRGLDGGISSGYSTKLILDSIAIISSTGEFYSGLYLDSNDSIILKNSLIQNCRGYTCVEIFVLNSNLPLYNEIISCRFDSNHADTSSSTESRHTTLRFFGSESEQDWNKTIINNSLFNDNIDSQVWGGYGGSVVIDAQWGCDLDVINSTFVYNLHVNNPGGGAIGVWDGSKFHFYNCILYGNSGSQVYLANTLENVSDTVSVNYSLLQDGVAGIIDYGPNNIVDWGEGNLDKDPLFLGTEQFPYAIDAGSPCIDAGTLALPPWITLPEYDIAGNPRVYGESIDMGAYEYGPWVSIKENPNSKFKIQNSKLIEVSPNPFSYGTYVSYELKENGRLNISVYSISGMKVKTLVNNTGSVGDKGNFYWDGSDQNGQALPCGAYILRMTIDDKVVEAVKVVRK